MEGMRFNLHVVSVTNRRLEEHPSLFFAAGLIFVQSGQAAARMIGMSKVAGSQQHAQ